MPSVDVGYMFNGQPALSEQAQRSLELKGDLPAQLLDPRLSLSVTVDDWTRPEYDFGRRMMGGWGGNIQAAVPAQFAGIGVGYITATPRDSAMICVVDQIIINNFTAGPLIYVVGLAHFSVAAYATGQIVCSDTRYQRPVGGGPIGTLARTVVGSNAAARVAGGVTVQVAAGQTFVLNTAFVAASVEALNAGVGGVVMVENTTLNSPVDVRFRIRERPALSSELT